MNSSEVEDTSLHTVVRETKTHGFNPVHTKHAYERENMYTRIHTYTHSRVYTHPEKIARSLTVSFNIGVETSPDKMRELTETHPPPRGFERGEKEVEEGKGEGKPLVTGLIE